MASSDHSQIGVIGRFEPRRLAQSDGGS